MTAGGGEAGADANLRLDHLTTSESSLDEVLPNLPDILAEEVRVLHARGTNGFFGGGDIDCALKRVRPWWSLRLDGGTRLCQSLRYDISATYHVFDRRGEVTAVDCLDDPEGIGKYGFSTRVVFEGDGRTDAVAAPAVRAAYLTVKRIRKNIGASRDWQRIAELARADRRTYERILTGLLGEAWGRQLCAVILDENAPPSERTLRIGQILICAGRYRNVSRGARILGLRVGRVFQRVTRPTGLAVLIVGPDGSGKSTLADSVADATAGLFRRQYRFHGHAGLLPRPGALVGRDPADTTTPHARPAHGPLVSYALLAYHWANSLTGHLLWIQPARLRTGLVVSERGFLDIVVDPRRYRIAADLRGLRLVSRLVPAPDIAFVLEGPAELAHARKPELSLDEIRRQTAEWRALMGRRVHVRFLSAAEPKESLAMAAREEIVGALEQREARRMEAGWMTVRKDRVTRFYIPRAPGRVSRTALRVSNPHRARGRIAWQLARLSTNLELLRLAPRGEAPPREVRARLAPYIPSGATIALSQATHAERFTALIIDERGEMAAVAKIATSDEAAVALRSERDALTAYGSLLSAPLIAPRVLAYEERILVLEPLEWRPRWRPWVLAPEVAAAIGNLWAASDRRVVHGDMAPWNLLRVTDGWALIDWEFCREQAPPFFDLFHYIVQAYVMLGRPTHSEILESVQASRGGWISDAIAAYAEAAGLATTEAEEGLRRYLHLGATDAALAAQIPDEARQKRQELATLLPGA